MLKKNKIILVLLLTIFCLSIGSVCAADIDADTITDDQAVVNDNTEISTEQISVEDTNVKNDVAKVEAAAQPVKENNEGEITKTSSAPSFAYYEELDDILDAAARYKAFIDKYHKLPKTVRVGAHTYSHEDFIYLMGKSIKNIDQGYFSQVQGKQLGSYKPINDKVNATLSKARYLVLVNVDLDWANKYGRHPNYVKLGEVKNNIRYDTYSYGYSKILTFYNDNLRLPATCTFDSSVIKSITPPGPDPKPVGTKVTINQILDAAKRYQNFVKKNGELPEFVNVGGKSFSKQQFTYAMAQAIYQLKNGNKKDITIPSSVKMCTLRSDKCNRQYTKTQFTDFARVVAEYVRGHGAVPSYIKYAGTVVPHIAYAAAFANILSFYKDNNGRLPNTALFTTKNLWDSKGAEPADDTGYPYGVDADALKESQNNVGSNNVNSNSKNLPATGNPILVLLFALAVLPILRFRK